MRILLPLLLLASCATSAGLSVTFHPSNALEKRGPFYVCQRTLEDGKITLNCMDVNDFATYVKLSDDTDVPASL